MDCVSLYGLVWSQMVMYCQRLSSVTATFVAVPTSVEERPVTLHRMMDLVKKAQPRLQEAPSHVIPNCSKITSAIGGTEPRGERTTFQNSMEQSVIKRTCE